MPAIHIYMFALTSVNHLYCNLDSNSLAGSYNASRLALFGVLSFPKDNAYPFWIHLESTVPLFLFPAGIANRHNEKSLFC